MFEIPYNNTEATSMLLKICFLLNMTGLFASVDSTVKNV